MIQIKSPCDANWQQMTPAESGKYCGACEKVVVDFSKMSDVQIKQYFTEFATQKTCGRFLDSQLDRPLVVQPLTRFNSFLNRLNQLPVARTILFFLTSTSMWISGCVKNNNDNMTTGDTTAVIENNNTELIGDTSDVIELQNYIRIKQDLNNVVMGEVAPEQNVKMLPPSEIMGDICVTPDELDTVTVKIPAINPDTADVTIHMIKGQVMLRDTITQKIKRKKK